VNLNHRGEGDVRSDSTRLQPAGGGGVIDWENWLMAERANFNNWIRSAMYEKQTELIGQLDDAREWNEYLVRVYSELQVRRFGY